MDPPAASDDMQAQIERLEATLRSQQTEMERFRQEASDSRALQSIEPADNYAEIALPLFPLLAKDTHHSAIDPQIPTPGPPLPKTDERSQNECPS